jgi:hemolysin activation/secretion protein
VAASTLRYKLGKEFAALDSTGNASDLTLYALTSLQRSRVASAQAQLALDIKRFDDSANGARSNKRAQVLALGLSANRQDVGASTGSLTLSAGRLQLDASAAATDAAGYRTAGSYTKLAGQFEHQRVVADNLVASVRLGAQLAGKNLDSSEKYALGGPQGVRAYAAGAAASDDGLLASAELAHEIWGLRAKVFADLGVGRIAHKPLATDLSNNRHLAAVGVGADAALPAGLQLQAAAALPLGSDDAVNERGPRLWLQLSKNF